MPNEPLNPKTEKILGSLNESFRETWAEFSDDLEYEAEDLYFTFLERARSHLRSGGSLADVAHLKAQYLNAVARTQIRVGERINAAWIKFLDNLLVAGMMAVV